MDGTAQSEAKMGEVQVSLNSTEKNLSILQEMTMKLIQRLAPVIRNEPAEKKDMAPVPKSSTPLAERIQQIDESIMVLASNIDSILYRLE